MSNAKVDDRKEITRHKEFLRASVGSIGVSHVNLDHDAATRLLSSLELRAFLPDTSPVHTFLSNINRC